MAERTLTARELNRALLARQMLLERQSLTVLDAMEQLAGLHAQIPSAPYIGLWSRLKDFQRDDLASQIHDRKIVKATLMRGTLHFFTTNDFLRFRAALQPMLSKGWASISRGRGELPSLETLVEVGRKYLAEPRTFSEISKHFEALYPGVDVGGMRYAVRSHVPLVQVPTDKVWSYPGNPKFALADEWLGQSIPAEDNLRELFLRYLGAFGPATLADFQTWSGFGSVKEIIAPLKSDLCIYRDEKGRELLDLPDSPIPDADTPAPIRFLGDLDNAMFGHVDRNRIIADDYRMLVLQVNAQGSKTILIDGMVRAVWNIEAKKKAVSFIIDPLEPISKPDRAAITDEAEPLIRFMEPDAQTYEIRFSE